MPGAAAVGFAVGAGFGADCCAAMTVASPRHNAAVPSEIEPTLFISNSPRAHEELQGRKSYF